MKKLTLLLSLLLIQNVLAKQPDDDLIAELVNNPVKESSAKFKFSLPTGFEIDKAKIVVKGGKKVKYKFKTDEIVISKIGADTFGSIIVSNLEPGEYEVGIKLIDKKNKKDHDCRFKMKNTLKDSTGMTIDSALEVADPGDEGKKTLAGIDSDNSGVRDDVQRWVNEQYQNKPSTKQALYQMSVATQNIILNSNNRDYIRNTAALNSSKAISCLSWITSDYINTGRALRSVVTNTEARVKAKLGAEVHFAGVGSPAELKNVRPGEENSLCNFSATKE